MNALIKFFLKHKAIVLILTVIALGASVYQLFQTPINSDVASYLPGDSSSKQAIDILRDEFSINGDALVCIEGGPAEYEQIKTLAHRLTALSDIYEVQWLGSYGELFKFDNNSIVSANPIIPDANVEELVAELYIEYEGQTYYILNLALVAANASSEAGIALGNIEEIMADCPVPYYIGGSATQSNNMLESALGELPMFLGVAVVIIAIILLFTSSSVMSAIIFLATIGISIAFNMGTNIFTSSISTVTFSVAAILQLALSMDYSIFLTHAYEEELKTQKTADAMLTAIKKTLVIIAASALTTVAGFCALFVMKYKLGFDLGLCLAKGVTFSFLTVIFVQPCLMLVFKKACDKTKLKNRKPEFKWLARLPAKLKLAAPIIAIILFIPAIYFTAGLNYYYLDTDYDDAATGPKAASQSVGNQAVFVFETVSDEAQLDLVTVLNGIDNVSGITGYYSIIDTISKDIKIPIYASLDNQNADTLIYEIKPSTEDIINISNGGAMDNDSIEASIKSAIMQYMIENSSTINEGTAAEIQTAVTAQLGEMQSSFTGFTDQFAAYQDKFFADIDGVQHTFCTLNIAGQAESPETMATVEKINQMVGIVLGTDNFYASGSTPTVMDLASTTNTDFMYVSVLSALLILIILIFTFKRFMLSVMLVLLIELAIFINLAFSAAMGTSLNFMSYIIISAIQLGATIDYAILMTKNFKSELELGDPFASAYEAVRSSAFPIIISVSILCCACLSVYFISSDTIIREITLLIARGAAISGVLVLFVLPSILALGSKKNGSLQK